MNLYLKVFGTQSRTDLIAVEQHQNHHKPHKYYTGAHTMGGLHEYTDWTAQQDVTPGKVQQGVPPIVHDWPGERQACVVVAAWVVDVVVDVVVLEDLPSDLPALATTVLDVEVFPAFPLPSANAVTAESSGTKAPKSPWAFSIDMEVESNAAHSAKSVGGIDMDEASSPRRCPSVAWHLTTAQKKLVAMMVAILTESFIVAGKNRREGSTICFEISGERQNCETRGRKCWRLLATHNPPWRLALVESGKSARLLSCCTDKSIIIKPVGEDR